MKPIVKSDARLAGVFQFYQPLHTPMLSVVVESVSDREGNKAGTTSSRKEDGKHTEPFLTIPQVAIKSGLVPQPSLSSQSQDKEGCRD